MHIQQVFSDGKRPYMIGFDLELQSTVFHLFLIAQGSDLNLRPVMTLKSRLLAVHQLAKGSSVSYGGLFVCPENMPVGVVEIGYGDGYPRHAAMVRRY